MRTDTKVLKNKSKSWNFRAQKKICRCRLVASQKTKTVAPPFLLTHPVHEHASCIAFIQISRNLENCHQSHWYFFAYKKWL